MKAQLHLGADRRVINFPGKALGLFSASIMVEPGCPIRRHFDRLHGAAKKGVRPTLALIDKCRTNPPSASGRNRRRELFETIVRRFLGDDHVVDVRLAQTRRRDANEAGLFLKFFDRATARVAHA